MKPVTITRHAAYRMREMCVYRQEVLDAIEDWEVRYVNGPSASTRRQGRRVCVRGRIVVIVNPRTNEVVSVLWNRGSEEGLKKLLTTTRAPGKMISSGQVDPKDERKTPVPKTQDHEIDDKTDGCPECGARFMVAEDVQVCISCEYEEEL